MRIPIALASIAMLSSCSRPMQLADHAFDVPAPEAWQGGELEESAPAAEWWTYFQDDRLDKSIRAALACNRNLKAAAARVDAAQEQVVIAGAGKLPTVDVGVNRLQQRQNFVGLPFPGLADSVLSNTFTSAGLSFNVAWEADFWNRISAEMLASRATAGRRAADVQAAALSLSGQAAKAWYAALEARDQISLAEAVLENARLTAERTQERYRFGNRSPVDVRLAEAEVARSTATVEQRKRALGVFVRQIEMLACEYPAGGYAPPTEWPDLPAQVPGGLPSDLVLRRPDLIALERALVAADARIVQARAQLRPSFSLTTGGGTSSNTLLDLVNPQLGVWNLGLNLGRPLFFGGRLKANVRATEAESREAVANYENQLWTAYLEVETVLSAEGSLLAQERLLEESLESTRRAITLAEQRYGAGMADIFSVLSLRRTALETESALIAFRRTRIDNRIDLHLALGGSFDTVGTDVLLSRANP